MRVLFGVLYCMVLVLVRESLAVRNVSIVVLLPVTYDDPSNKVAEDYDGISMLGAIRKWSP